MSELPVLIVGYLFAGMGFLVDHALLVGAAIVLAWLLLLVPAGVWGRALNAVKRPFAVRTDAVRHAEVPAPVRRTRELQPTH
ncbi:hypothetical protein FOS14_10895 [Skermania sp. ID1734]|uniref:hypothetical protein n=1 Tax=Skermania sp. ID1734 TaxID=2597516 RepID=UPI001180A379|nr:hypothetical protein [Skermania sp. ID1734]TSD99757.1 hypothetical protein FOS14_10895 [Skermania sp. ID1734]